MLPSYNLSIKAALILELSPFTHKGILIMATLAFMRKLFTEQKLHLHTVLEPNWGGEQKNRKKKSEALLKKNARLCQER